jgi:hypothetical protein
MQCDLVESVPLSQDNQNWIREEIHQAMHPNGWRKALDVLRYWGVLGTVVTAFLALIAMAITLGIFSANKISKESEFEGTTSTRLADVEKRLGAIETGLLALRAVQAANKPTDKTSIAQAKEILATAQKNSVQLPADVIEQAGRSFIEASSKEPAAWDAALRFVQYRSYLNITLEVLPLPSGAKDTTTEYFGNAAAGFPRPALSIAGLISKDKAARFSPIGKDLTTDTGFGNQWILATGGGLALDGMQFKNVVFRNVHVVYMGGPLEMQNVYFVGCTFDFVRGAHGQEIAGDILSSPAVTATIS